MEKLLYLLPVIIPMIAGLMIGYMPVFHEKKTRQLFTAAVLFAEIALLIPAFTGNLQPVVLINCGDSLPILFSVDTVSKIFIALVAVMWIASGFVSFEYMNHEKNHERYYAFFLLSEGALVGLGFCGNYFTFYLFYELMTLLTMPLALHSGTKEAIAAGVKYVMYSIAGASMGLLGFFVFSHYATTTQFIAGGTLDMSVVAGHEALILVTAFLVIVGFGGKAGMIPLHAWLPTAHPVAPAPASAVLSGVITKAGVLAIIRVIYYQVGVGFLRGTWVHYALLALSLTTVLMGSTLAFKEKVLKKRLAYSTISQVSYVLFGLFVMNQTAFTGAMLHIVSHSVIKDVLFLSAGAIIYKTHKTNVTELRGIGKEMPIVIWCFTIVSLSLIGIPPLGGFVSKFYLAVGSLEAGAPIFAWLGPVILLISALLTAGYLFTITIMGFFPGEDYDYSKLESKEPTLCMTVPLVVLTIVAILVGLYPKPLLSLISTIVIPGL